MSEIDINQVLAQMRSMGAQAGGGPNPANPATEAGGAEFSTMLRQYVDQVNATSKQAGALTEAFVTESAQVDLTEVMVALQKASVSFKAMTEVRNKLVSAYQEVMSMQV